MKIRLPPRLGCLLLSLTLASAAQGDPVDRVEGVYHYHNGYQAETLELRAGHFRYWFSTDYGLKSGDHPLEGSYSIEGATLTLHRDDIHLGSTRIFESIKSTSILWRPEALVKWHAQGKINTYGVLVKLPDPPEDLSNLCLPIPDEACAVLREQPSPGISLGRGTTK